MKYYIGVDGGGTKTAFALFDENKNMLSLVEGKGSNHENLEGSFSEAADILADGINSLLKENGKTLSDIDGILMGLAGIDHPYQHDAVCAELEKRGISGARIYNDGFIVIKAGACGAGIGYNCGTGTCCNSVDSRGEMLQVGGFDRLSGDKGNGHWLATECYRIAYDDICLKKRKSLVTELLKERLGVNDRDSLLALLQKLESDEAESVIRTLIVAFFECANKGDEACLEVIEEMAQRGADFPPPHPPPMQFDGDEVNVVLSGSMHTKLPSDLYIKRMGEIIKERSGRNIKFIKLNAAPVTGCVNWLLEDEAK